MSLEVLHKANQLICDNEINWGIKTKLKIDILSDTHFDNYFYGKYTNYDVINFYCIYRSIRTAMPELYRTLLQ